MRRTITALTALALFVSGCGSGTADEDRNVAIPGAATLAQLLPQGISFAPGQTAAVAVAGTENGSCVIDHVGGLWCWGRRSSPSANPQPVDVSSAPVKVRVGNDLAVTAVSSGEADTTCAVADAKVWCWGANFSRTVDPKVAAQYVSAPVMVQGIPDPVIDVATTRQATCAVTVAGRVWCWGDGRGFGFGQAAASNYQVSGPLDLGFALGATKIIGAESTFCVVNGLSELWCWGRNLNGLVGVGSNQPMFTPVRVPVRGTVVSASMTISHICVVLLEGQLKCWGENSSYQLGTGDTSLTAWVPYTVPDLGHVPVDVATGDRLTCILTSTGSLVCWGNYPGTVNNWFAKIVTPGMTNLMSISASRGRAVCGVTWTGELKCVGDDFEGALGNGDGSTSMVATGQRIGTFGTAGVAVATTVAAPTTTAAATTTTRGAPVSVVTVLPINPSTLAPATTIAGAGAGVTPVTPPTTVTPQTTTPGQSTMPPTSTSVPVVCCPPDGGFASPESTEVKLPAVSAANESRRVLTIKKGKGIADQVVARFAGLTTPKGSKLTVSVSAKSKRTCARSGARVVGAKLGTCRMTVKMTPKGGKTLVRIVNAQVVR